MPDICISIRLIVKSVFSLSRRLETRHCPHLLLRPRAEASLLPGAPRSRSIFPARGAPSSKPAARHYCGRSTGQTDRQTDGRTSDRYIDPAAHTIGTVPINCAYVLCFRRCDKAGEDEKADSWILRPVHRSRRNDDDDDGDEDECRRLANGITTPAALPCHLFVQSCG